MVLCRLRVRLQGDRQGPAFHSWGYLSFVECICMFILLRVGGVQPWCFGTPVLTVSAYQQNNTVVCEPRGANSLTLYKNLPEMY